MRLENGLSLVYAGVCLVLSVGLTACSREGGEEPGSPSPAVAEQPASYMKDAAFRQALAEKRGERNELLATRDKLVAKLGAMAAAMREKMPGAEDEAVRLALEKDPEWNSLVARVNAVKEAYDDNRAATLRKVRDRIGVSTNTISK